ncbi:hypothetical protein ACKFKF_04915 [Phormidesmis sp. 146-12]
MRHSKLALLMTSVMMLSSVSIPSAANAQVRVSDWTSFDRVVTTQRTLVPAGTRISVQHEKDQIFVAASEGMPLTLTVRNPVFRNNRIVIPAGAQIEGELRPAGTGSRFVARTLILQNGQRYEIAAQSSVVSHRETIRQNPKLGRVLTGAGIGAAAAAILAGITGDRKIDALEVIGGAAVGGAGSFALGKQQSERISIRPHADLTLELRSDLAFR